MFFLNNNMTVSEDIPMELFYSGETIFGKYVSFPIRRALSKYFGSSCHMYIVRFKKGE